MTGEQEIGTLITKFVADLTGLQQGVTQYDAELDKAKKSTEGLNNESINLAASINNAQSLYNYGRQALTLYTDAFESAYGAVDAFNRMTGTTVVQGGKWNEIMEQNHLELGSLTMAFRMLAMNVESARDGTGRAADAFKTLHVNIYDTNGQLKDSNTIMLETMTALSKVANAGERSALAQDTIGRAQMSINKLWADGKNMLEIYDATQTKMTANGMYSYKEYEAATGRLNSAQSDLMVSLGKGLIPMFTTFVNYLTDHVIPAIDKIGDALSFFGYRIAAMSAAIKGEITWDQFEKMSTYEYYSQAQFLEKANAAANEKAKYIEDQNAKSNQPASSNAGALPWETTGGASSGGTSSGGSGGSSGSGGSAEEQWLLEKGEAGIRSWKGFTPEQVTKYILAYRKLSEGRVTADLDELNQIQEHLKLQVKGSAEAQRDIDLIHELGYRTAVDIARLQNNALTKEWNELVKNIEKNPAEAEIRINTTYTTTGGGGGGGTGGTGWSQGGASWDGIGVGTYGSEMYLFMQQWYLKGATYQEALKHWAEGEGVPNAGISTSGQKDVEGRASGGPTIAGIPYLVGERGPEIFAPDTNGTILPNMSTGGTANIYIELDGDTIAQKIAAPLVSEIRVRTGIR
jgi:uncharacterized membrane protein YgcG